MSHLHRRNTWCDYALILSIGITTVSTASGQAPDNGDLLPGEIRLDFGDSLVSPSRVPTVRDIIRGVESDAPTALSVIRIHHSDDNHYAPTWSADGTSLAFLRSDLTAGTRKTVLKGLGQQTTTLYEDRTSFEDLTTWCSGNRNLLIFESTNEPAGGHNIHQAAVDDEPRRITDGSGVVDFPAMHAGASHNYLVLRRDRELYLAVYELGTTDPVSVESIGEGEEAQPSPSGQFLAVVRRTELGNIYRLEIRELRGTREKPLHEAEGAIIRNPRFSPDGTQIAFHSRNIQENGWGLWVVPINGSSPARKVVADIRVQEDFRHVGPSWSPSSKGIWYFANAQTQAHYSLRYVNTANDQSSEVTYPSQITSASEVAINPVLERPVILFAGHTDKPRDIFAILLSRSP